MAKTFSGKRVIAVLTQKFGFSVISQKGSHVKLRRRTSLEIRTTIVPLHKELAPGTLRSILELANVSYEDFMKGVK